MTTTPLSLDGGRASTHSLATETALITLIRRNESIIILQVHVIACQYVHCIKIRFFDPLCWNNCNKGGPLRRAQWREYDQRKTQLITERQQLNAINI
jgi:hypothetical protein